MVAPGTDQVATVRAISAEAGELLWMHEARAPTSPSSGCTAARTPRRRLPQLSPPVGSSHQRAGSGCRRYIARAIAVDASAATTVE